MPDILLYGVLVLLAASLAGGAIAALTWLWPTDRARSPIPLDSLAEPRRFTFRDGYLVSSEAGVGFLLPQPVDRLSAWDDLSASLSSLLPGATDAMRQLSNGRSNLLLEGQVGRDQVRVTGIRRGPEILISVSTADKDQCAIRMDTDVLAAVEKENELLTCSQNTAPGLAWAVDGLGQIVWANHPYMEEVLRCQGPDAAAAWPVSVLFPNGEDAPKGPVRRMLRGSTQGGKADRWYEVTLSPPTEDEISYGHAQPLGRLIDAEESLRTFIDTLTRTFTTLPIGLAIFDAQRKLVMFNPPLLDMTGLDGAWLASRPHLIELLDAMREERRLPEPRDWRAWRDALVAAGRDETGDPWHETWTLPEGQSFRMTARPQSDGAVAILLEDITAEMALARRRRSDSEVLVALLDTNDDAIAAFGPDGTGLHLNRQMRRMSGFDIDMPPDLTSFLGRMRDLSEPSPLWSELRDIGRNETPRTSWMHTVQFYNAGLVRVHVLPLGEGRVALRLTKDHSEADKTPPPSALKATAKALVQTSRTRPTARTG